MKLFVEIEQTNCDLPLGHMKCVCVMVSIPKQVLLEKLVMAERERKLRIMRHA